MTLNRRMRLAASMGVGLLALAGCSFGPRLSAQDCMERAMYFESNRSSRDGMIAVGSVVMNRVESGKFPNSVCEVVGQKNQFAKGVLTRKMDSRSMPMIHEAARSVMRGERHPMVADAMFFHTAGHRFSYDNMHYVLTTGGNSFYEKRKSALVTRPYAPPAIEGITRR